MILTSEKNNKNGTGNINKLSVSLLLILPLICFGLYSNALSLSFVTLWDDACYITENPHIQQLNQDSLIWMLSSLRCGNWHPLTWLSHTLDYTLYGLNPWGHHLSNIILHSFNTLWVYLLSILILVLAQHTQQQVSIKTLWQIGFKHSIYWLSAGFAALLFAIHPQHVESVAWVSERKDVLCLFFMLPAVLFYLLYTRSQQLKQARFWYSLALLCQILALLAKPMAVSLPLILVLLDIYPLRRNSLINYCAVWRIKPWFTQRYLWEKVPFVLLVIGSVGITLFAQQQGGAMATTQQISLDIRLLNAANSLITYLQHFVVPTTLVPFYPFPLIEYLHLNEHPTRLLPVALFSLISFLCLRYYRQQPWWLIAWLFYLLTLLPVIGIVQVGSQALADRYTYLPLLPLYLLLGVGMVLLIQHKRLWIRLFSQIIGISFIVMLVLITRQQITVWQNDLSFWSQTLQIYPDNGYAHSKLAKAYHLAGNDQQASQHYYFAIGLEGDSRINYWYAFTLERTGRVAEAIQQYEKAIKQTLGTDADQKTAWVRLRQLYTAQGNKEKAIFAAQQLSLLLQEPIKPNLENVGH